MLNRRRVKVSDKLFPEKSLRPLNNSRVLFSRVFSSIDKKKESLSQISHYFIYIQSKFEPTDVVLVMANHEVQLLVKQCLLV